MLLFGDLVKQVQSEFWLEYLNIEIHIARDRPTLLDTLLSVKVRYEETYTSLILSL